MSYKNWPKAQKLDWSTVNTARRGGALPRWLYFGEIIEAAPGLTGEKSKNPGSHKVSVTIAIGGSHGDLVDVGSRKSFNHFTFSEKAMWKCKQFCEALGCEPPASTTEEDLQEFSETVIGETVWFILKEVKNQKGDPDNEVEAFIAEAEVDEVAEGMEPPGAEAPRAASKSKGRTNGASTNGRSAKAAEMDTDEDADDESDDDTDEDEAPAAVEAEPRRRGRPPKDRSARR